MLPYNRWCDLTMVNLLMVKEYTVSVNKGMSEEPKGRYSAFLTDCRIA